jgi:hypothetical protein
MIRPVHSFRSSYEEIPGYNFGRYRSEYDGSVPLGRTGGTLPTAAGARPTAAALLEQRDPSYLDQMKRLMLSPPP